jgi:DNA-binding XRE family transcriptional regulator
MLSTLDERRLIVLTRPARGRLPLRRLRRRAKLTQQELANRVGISRRTLWTIEHTGRCPRIETARRLAEALCVDVHDVVHLSHAYRNGGARRASAYSSNATRSPGEPLIGRSLRAAREMAGVSQREMVRRLGVSRSTYQQYEAGRWRPEAFGAFQQRVLEALGITP